MDVVRQVLEAMAKTGDAVTARHISRKTGLAPSTLIGVMMGMINQRYITEVIPESGSEQPARCSCACCTSDQEKTSSLDRRIYQITPRGRTYLQNWEGKTR
ncbi:helix-turn-helix domain-containing protein [uncultured Methanospirillum sp.]|uniref:helix-turn-helix domain-containing protein n=1 Tax=uncultured Methanospirillum sp. TaxID=262503 RepID=UPI0029C683FB|nr:helix-turn-helix domain-containing protein [uncultured Methanospirillum sp.]